MKSSPCCSSFVEKRCRMLPPLAVSRRCVTGGVLDADPAPEHCRHGTKRCRAAGWLASLTMVSHKRERPHARNVVVTRPPTRRRRHDTGPRKRRRRAMATVHGSHDVACGSSFVQENSKGSQLANGLDNVLCHDNGVLELGRHWTSRRRHANDLQ
jgi:hypothetical protein